MTTIRSIFRFSKPRRRAWACIIAGLTLAAIWWVSLGASLYYSNTLFGGGMYMGTVNGYVFKEPRPLTGTMGLTWNWPNWSIYLWPVSESNAKVDIVRVPLYPLALILLTYGLLRLYRLREVPAHLCTHCRYDRRGIPASTPCPECGTTPATQPI